MQCVYRINIEPDKLNLSVLHQALINNEISEKDLIIVDGCSSHSEFYEVIDLLSNKWAKRALMFQIGRSDTDKVFYGGAE